jgi:hypothetical protein
MSNDSDRVTVSRPLTMATIVFAAASALHGIDHLRGGMAASPMAVMIGGTIQGLFRGGRSRAGPVPTSTGFRGHHRGGVRKCGAVFLCARAASPAVAGARGGGSWPACPQYRRAGPGTVSTAVCIVETTAEPPSCVDKFGWDSDQARDFERVGDQVVATMRRLT